MSDLIALIDLGSNAARFVVARLPLGTARRRGGIKKRRPALGRRELERLRSRLEVIPLRERKKLPGLTARRADIIVAGAIVLEELMDFLGCLEFSVCDASVREGVLFREAAARWE